jgi:hypothetical protein
MKSIFLSHSSNDKKFAGKLGDGLRKFGFRVWIDSAEIRPGDSLAELIASAIDQIDVLCVILSPDSAVSKWVAKEIQLAKRKHASIKGIRIIPLIYRPTKVPRSLSDRLFIDFSEPLIFDEVLIRLVDALGLFETPAHPLTGDELDEKLERLSSGFPLLSAILTEAKQDGGISVASARALEVAKIPSKLVELFLLLLAQRYDGRVRFGVALTAVDLVNAIGVGKQALEYCLKGNHLEESKRFSVGARMVKSKEVDTLSYLHDLFVRTIRIDSIYQSIIYEHFDQLRDCCYDQIRSYLLYPDRGPGKLNWDTFCAILHKDAHAMDLKTRVEEWIKDGEFEKPTNNVTTVAYRYCNRIITEHDANLYFIIPALHQRLRGLLNSPAGAPGAIYHLRAICAAEYADRREIQSLVGTSEYSAPSNNWPAEAIEIVMLIQVYLDLLNAEDDEAKSSRLSYLRKKLEALDNLSGFKE